MKLSLYRRLDHLPSASLMDLAEHYERLDESRPKPRRMNWYAKIAMRARVILAARAESAQPLPQRIR
jgi:hypothetical protein